MRRRYGILHVVAVITLVTLGASAHSSLRMATTTGARRLRSQEERGANQLAVKVQALVVNPIKLRNWLSKDKSVDYAFTSLQLNTRVDKVLASPYLNNLKTYVDMFNKKYPDKKVSLIGTLKAHYGGYAVTEAILLRKYGGTRLRLLETVDWFDNGKSVDDVFALLKFVDDQPTSLQSLKFDALVFYTMHYLEHTPSAIKNDVNLFLVMRRGFDSDDKFAMMLSKAIELDDASLLLKETAGRFEGKLFKRWTNSNVHPNDVLTEVFKIPKDKLASAGDREKAIATKYENYYIYELGLDQISTVVKPRRD